MDNYLLDFHFQVEWGGARTDMTSVSGLTFSREILSVNVGTNKETTDVKTLGKKLLSPIRMRRLLFANDNEFFDWWLAQDKPGKIDARNIAIKLLDKEHKPVFIFQLRDAQPVSISYSPITAEKAEAVWEELEIIYQGISVTGSGSKK